MTGDSYALQAEAETWATIADNAPAASPITHPVTDRVYRGMIARYGGSCAGCPNRVRPGQAIVYSADAPRSLKVYHAGCLA